MTFGDKADLLDSHIAIATTNHQPPTTSHQPPTTNHEPPTTNHQPPTTSRRRRHHHRHHHHHHLNHLLRLLRLLLPLLSPSHKSAFFFLQAFDDKADLLGSRIATERGMDITPEQMEELKSSFKAFDHEKRGKLGMEEFRQSQEAMGQELTPEELESTFQAADADGDGLISFDEFVAHMQRLMNVTDSYADIAAALAAAAGDTIADGALAAMVSPEVAEYVLGVAPRAENGEVDVKGLLAMLFDVQ